MEFFANYALSRALSLSADRYRKRRSATAAKTGRRYLRQALGVESQRVIRRRASEKPHRNFLTCISPYGNIVMWR